MRSWTKPYYGVTHFGRMSTSRPWASVQDLGKGNGAVACIYWRPSPRNEEVWCIDVDAAKAFVEKELK